MAMSATACTTLQQLPYRSFGTRKIRYICLDSAKNSFMLTGCLTEGSMVPLFLGADIFSITDIRSENHTRHHGKFAKKGLSTKVTFSQAFRFQGIKVSAADNSLWFYNIQGLFRIAFEMYSVQEQLGVLENLQDIWKSRIHDSPLQMSYSLSAQLDPTLPTSTLVEQYDQDLKLKLMSQARHPSKSIPSPLVGSDTDGTSSNPHDFSHSERGFSSQLNQKLQCLEVKLCSESELRPEQLETIVPLLEIIERCISRQLEECDVAETVLALLQARQRYSVYSSHLLNSVGRWLGQQFHAANGTISLKVEDFKEQHIERIADLPPAEELATELFPEAMRTLLLHWMGLNEDSTVEKRHSEYPILLLILEFANHNLITGVAHVLYSSLICK
ncbi:uncharacterized protein FYW47_013382 [Aplochiton taeniatus]